MVSPERQTFDSALPTRSDVDRILANLGEDYNHDTIDDLDHAETAVAVNDKEAIDTDSEATTDSENLDKTSSDTADQSSIVLMEHGEGGDEGNAVTLSHSHSVRLPSRSFFVL